MFVSLLLLRFIDADLRLDAEENAVVCAQTNLRKSARIRNRLRAQPSKTRSLTAVLEGDFFRGGGAEGDEQHDERQLAHVGRNCFTDCVKAKLQSDTSISSRRQSM